MKLPVDAAYPFTTNYQTNLGPSSLSLAFLAS